MIANKYVAIDYQPVQRKPKLGNFDEICWKANPKPCDTSMCRVADLDSNIAVEGDIFLGN